MDVALKTVTGAVKKNEKVVVAKGIKSTIDAQKAPNESKRAALGELGNRLNLKTNDNALNLKKNILTKKDDKIKTKETKTVSANGSTIPVYLKNVKPRVDTHWQKNENQKLSKIIPKPTNVPKTETNISAIQKQLQGKMNCEKGLLPNQNNLITKNLKVKLRKPDLQKQEMVNNNQKEKNNFEEIQRSLSSCEEPKIQDIDALSENDYFLNPEYASEIYDYLRTLEKKYAIKENHLADQHEITPKMRSILIDWLNDIHSQFHLLAETYYMTVGIVDLYLQAVPTVRKQELQLVGTAATFIASKFEELYSVDISELAFTTANTYTCAEIIQMEQKILKVLNFELSRPLLINFIRRFSKAADATNMNHQAAKYFSELTTIEYSLAHYKPSEIAAASVYLSLFLFKKNENDKFDNLWTPTLEYYTKYNKNHLLPLVKELVKVVLNAPNSRFKAIYSKYENEKYERVAIYVKMNTTKLLEFCIDKTTQDQLLKSSTNKN